MPLISVIVSVYNVEKYLSKCVDSILAQRIPEMEVILVDDGSKDSSLAICNAYAERDSRVRVVAKANGGVSSARNCGLDNATGDWVTFVDADDWLEEDALAECLPYMGAYEIVRFSALDVFADGRTRRRRLRHALDWDEAFRQVVGHRTRLGVWGTVYRRILFERNKIRFDTEIVYGEDWLALATVMSCSRSVKTLPDLYGYVYNRANEASCSNTISCEKYIQSLVVVKHLGEIAGEGYDEELVRSRCYRTGMLVKHFGCRKAYKALMENRERIELIALRDIVSANIHLSLRCRLLRLWFGYLAWQ